MSALSRAIETHQIDAVLMIGGIDGYDSVHRLYAERAHYPALAIPMICLPASIDNNLPGTELSVGADTALNAIVEAIDRIKLSGSATQRCFVVEAMGRYCGYLALMSAIAGGADYVIIPEQPPGPGWHEHMITVLRRSRDAGRRTSIVVIAEGATDTEGHPIDAEHVRRILTDDGTLRNITLNFPNAAASTSAIVGGGSGNAFRS